MERMMESLILVFEDARFWLESFAASSLAAILFTVVAVCDAFKSIRPATQEINRVTAKMRN